MKLANLQFQIYVVLSDAFLLAPATCSLFSSTLAAFTFNPSQQIWQVLPVVCLTTVLPYQLVFSKHLLPGTPCTSRVIMCARVEHARVFNLTVDWKTTVISASLAVRSNVIEEL